MLLMMCVVWVDSVMKSPEWGAGSRPGRNILVIAPPVPRRHYLGSLYISGHWSIPWSTQSSSTACTPPHQSGAHRAPHSSGTPCYVANDDPPVLARRRGDLSKAWACTYNKSQELKHGRPEVERAWHTGTHPQKIPPKPTNNRSFEGVKRNPRPGDRSME
jgi:hypothetical protein